MTWGKFILNHVDCYVRPQENGVAKQPQAREIVHLKHVIFGAHNNIRSCKTNHNAINYNC